MGREEIRFRSRNDAQFLALLEKIGLPEGCRIPRTGSFHQNAEHLAATKAAKLVGLIRMG
jgi:hypothetical protein